MPLVKRPLTPAEAEWYAKQGYDPSKITAEVEVPDKPTSALAAGARGTGAAALPTIAGGAATGAAMAGIPSLIAGLGFAPLTGGASLLIPAAALATGAGAGILTAKAQEAVMPESWKEQLAKDIEEHPIASRVGQVAALPLGGFNPGKDVLKAGAYGVNKLIGLPTTREGAQAAVNTAMGAGLGVVQEGAMQAFRGDLDPEQLAESALIGSVFTSRNRLGKAYGFHAPEPRAVDVGNPAFKLGRKAVVSAEKEKVQPQPEPQPAAQTQRNFRELVAQPELPVQTDETPVVTPPAPKPRTPSIVELENMLKKSKYTGAITPEVLQGWQEVMAEHGLVPEIGEIAGAKGEYVPKVGEEPPKVKLDASKASVTTAPHEVSHHIWTSMPEKVRANYEELIKPEVERINKEREAWNKSNPEEQMRPIDAEEFFASEMGVKAALRAASGENTGLKNWWADTKAGLTARYGDPTVGDIYRTELVRLMNGKTPLSVNVKAVQQTEPAKKQPYGEDIIGEPTELDVSKVEDTKQQERLDYWTDRKAKEASEKAELGLTGKRTAGVKPATYPQDETYKPPAKAPERRHELGEPTPGEVDLIEKTLHNAFNYHFNRLKGRSSLYSLPKETIQDIKGRTIEKIMQEGVESSEAGGLRNTVFRRMNEAINDEIADYKKNRQGQVSLQKPVGEEGKTELGDVTAAKQEGVAEKVMAKEEGTLGEEPLPIETEAPAEEALPEETKETEVVSKKPTVKAPTEKPVKVHRAMSDVIARVEQVRKDLVAEGEPVKNAKKIAAIDDALDMLRNLPPEESFDVAKIMKGKFQGEGEDIELPEGYRKVNLVKPDGAKEEVLFNDKYYEGLPGGKRASYARMTPEGKMSHSVARKDETIEEVGVNKQQGEDEDIFVPRSLNIAQKPPVGLTNSSGAFNGSTLVNYLRNTLTPVEFGLLQKAGIEKEFGGRLVKKEEVADWINENLPKIKVHVYGMEGNVSPEKRRFDDLVHHWYEQLDDKMRTSMGEVLRLDLSPDESIKKLLERYSWQGKSKDLMTAREFFELDKKFRNVPPSDFGPRATSAYDTVSALPTNEPMPEWTTSKEGKNVQRVDVVIPKKYTEIDEQGEGGYTKPVLWQPDNLHENLPNTLGWAMLQYTDAKSLLAKVKQGLKLPEATIKFLNENPDAQIAFVGEVQSRWGQEVRKQGGRSADINEWHYEIHSKNDDVIGGPEHVAASEAEAKQWIAEHSKLDKEGLTVQERAVVEGLENGGSLYTWKEKGETVKAILASNKHNVDAIKLPLRITSSLEEKGLLRYHKDSNETGTVWELNKPEYNVKRVENLTKYKPIDHPLLRDYNRLILKAAIEQARKEGATHIVVSDAESAMMTEGHDLHSTEAYPTNVKHIQETTGYKDSDMERHYGENWQNGQYMSHEGTAYRVDKSPDNKILDIDKEMVERMRSLNGKRGYIYPAQEPGMRLNYDIILPKIMEELTGSKSEKVSLGEHKNAYGLGEAGLANIPEGLFEAPGGGDLAKTPRKNLIFRNPDNTPKTDISGMMYPLEQVKKRLESGEKFSTYNKFQGETEDIDTGRQGFFKSWAGTFDKLKKVEPKLAEAFNRWETQKDIYEGWGNTAAKDLQKYNRDEVNEVFAAHREAFREGTELPEFEGKKAEISDILTDYFHDSIGEERRDIGLEINQRTPGLNLAYVPDMLSAQAADLLVNKPYLPEAKAAAREWAEYIVEASDGNITMEEAKEYVKHYIRAMGSTSGNYLSVDFGPIRKAEGFGVPESLREKDALKVLLRYSRRAARDLAMFKELESDREIAAMLELNDRVTGQTVTHENTEPLSQLQEVKNAMKWVTGDFGSTQAGLQTPKFTALVRLVNNLIMGPATGLRDTATVPLNMVPYLNSFNDLSAALTGIYKFRENARESLEYGATKPNIDKIQFQDLAQSPDKFTDFFRKAATLARKYQGREHIENFNRDITFSIGKELTKANIIGARAGKESSKQFLKKFGTLVDGDITTMEGETLDKALNITAKNFTDRNQGTYGGRGLPVGMVDSQFAPFFSLQKWSLEKSNVIWKDVFKPFISGENRLPMITYLLGSVMTGAAIQELNKVLTGKKSQDPEVKEVLAEGSAEDYVAKLVSLMQLGSYSGIISDIAKGATDAAVYGKTPRNIASFPTASLALDLQEKIAFVAEAIGQGENPVNVINDFALDIMSQNVQLARMIANRTVKEERIERSEKFRDLRVYNQLKGGKQERFPLTNPYLDLETREFKRTSDLEKAKELSGNIKKNIKEESTNRSDRERAFRSAKTMSYRTVPSRETDPIGYRRYYKYLVETQGKEKADEIIRDNRRQRRLNTRKAKMLP